MSVSFSKEAKGLRGEDVEKRCARVGKSKGWNRWKVCPWAAHLQTRFLRTIAGEWPRWLSAAASLCDGLCRFSQSEGLLGDTISHPAVSWWSPDPSVTPEGWTDRLLMRKTRMFFAKYCPLTTAAVNQGVFASSHKVPPGALAEWFWPNQQSDSGCCYSCGTTYDPSQCGLLWSVVTAWDNPWELVSQHRDFLDRFPFFQAGGVLTADVLSTSSSIGGNGWDEMVQFPGERREPGTQ